MWIKNLIKNTTFRPKFFEIMKWVMIDAYRKAKNPEDRRRSFVKRSGIFIITGRTGGGKTTAALALVDDYVRQFGRENLYIASNTYIEGQDFQITHWGDLTLFYNKPLVMIYDECNADFPQNQYKNIEPQLRMALAQNRKGNGKAIFAISQDYNMLLNEFRRLSKKVFWCKTIFGRYTRAKSYDTMEYEEMIHHTDIAKKMKIRPEMRMGIVQTDKFRSRYSSFALVKSIKKPFEEYVVRKELLPYIDYEMTDIKEYKVEWEPVVM